MKHQIDWQFVEEDVLSGLKPFQRRTVEWAFACLFPVNGRPCSGRFLVADEVGLGKTMVAKGVLVKTLRHLQNKVGRVDIVYICSNADIAQQNMRRLSIPALENAAFSAQGRLTLMPLIPRSKDGTPERASALPKAGVNFQALTPGTSLDFRNDSGHVRERALLVLMVAEVLPDVSMTRWKNLFAQQVRRDRFEAEIQRLGEKYAIDPQLQRRFSQQLRRRVRGGSLLGRLEALADRFPRQRTYRPRDPDQRDAAALIADLRRALAGVCIEALQPDLLILDEFQRFPHLLASGEPDAELARQLYESESNGHSARVLMLSATPYPMSSVGEDNGAASHHEEFLAMVGFLLRDDEPTLGKLKTRLEAFNDALRSLDPADTASLEALREEIQSLLHQVMSRTDRTPTSEERDAMVSTPSTAVFPGAVQMRTYVGLQRIARVLEVPNLLEYWRSAPAPLSFLSGYKLRDRLVDALGTPSADLCEALATPGLFLGEAGVVGAESGHARTAAMARTLIDAGLHRIAWLPPSKPGHALGGPFATLGDAARTKRLLFSSWRMVPRAVSTVLDGMVTAVQVREFGAPSQRRHDETDGDYMLGYPSAVLAELGHPDQWAAACQAEGVMPTVDALVKYLAPHVERHVDKVMARFGGDEQGTEDYAWYWMGPALADHLACPRCDHVDGVPNTGPDPFDLKELEGVRDGEVLWDPVGIENRKQRWNAVTTGQARLGRPPEDLVTVLCRLALASPAVCALRTLSEHKDDFWSNSHRQVSSGVAAALMRYLGHEQTVQMLSGLYPAERSFATRVLRHAMDGGLQAVLDEYLIVLDVDQPHDQKEAKGSLAALAQRLAQMETALRLRPAVLRPEVLRQEGNAWRLMPEAQSLRFARPLLEDSGDGDERDGPTAMAQLRSAFNSPFLPFVLSSTSIGQEGLDFHWYCHAIVHWNLPSSPVDFEQRDGRIHRYRNHAVRRNVVRDWGGAALQAAPGRAGWDWMFDRVTEAARAAGNDAGGMRPSWVYREGDCAAPAPTPGWMLDSMGAAARIERHIPVIPHSRDVWRLQQMTKAVGMYRMVFAQPRQDELLAHLQWKYGASTLEGLAARIVIDLQPPENAISGRDSPVGALEGCSTEMGRAEGQRAVLADEPTGVALDGFMRLSTDSIPRQGVEDRS